MERKELTADKIACKLLYRPSVPEYTDVHCRQFQGCPTVAVTKGGRIYLGWYTGGTCEPHMDNFNLLVYSDDDGATWSDPLLVIPSDRDRWVHALDIQLWIAPNGHLFVFWVQNNTEPVELGREGCARDGFVFYDSIHAAWMSVCENPDADNPVFSAPRCWDKGFLRCKPTVLENGSWLCFNYDQATKRYGYSISADQGGTFQHRYGAEKIPTPFDEGMAYQRRDGSIRMFARTSVGWIAESSSFDGGMTWTDAKCNDIPNANARLYVGRTPSGRILLVNNDHSTSRCNMTVYLSDDDGDTWAYRRCIDARSDISYPDVDYKQGKIYLTYDRERCGAKEILLVTMTEDDIIHPENPIVTRIVSRP